MAIKIFVDADAFVALTVKTDSNHEKARSLLNRLTVNPVLFRPRSRRRPLYTLVTWVIGERLPCNLFKINVLIFFDTLSYAFISH